MCIKSDFVRRLRSALVSILIAVCCVLSGILGLSQESAAQVAQPDYQAQGPAPINGNLSGPLKPATGAVQAIVPDPNDADTIYLGAVNGGIWKTTKGGTSWTPMTDSQSALSIGALTLDANDRNRLLAGLAIFSNFSGDGGPRNGLLFSPDAGTTWSPTGALMRKNTNISSLLFNDQFILASSRSNIFEADHAPSVTPALTGLFRSLDGGKSFIPISGAGGLAAGRVTSLARSGSPGSAIYAAVLNQGIYRSDNGGKTWSDVTSSAMNIQGGNSQNIQLAVGANGKSLFAGVINGQGVLQSVWRSTNLGNTWQNMGGQLYAAAPLSQGLPGTIEEGKFSGLQQVGEKGEGGQGSINFALSADAQNSNRVYASGQSQTGTFIEKGDQLIFINSIGAQGYTGSLFVTDAARSPSDPPNVASWGPATPYNGQWLPITDNFANGTSVHADSRVMVFDKNGNLLEGDDGGIYRLTNLGTPQQTWSSLNNLQITEFYSIAYDRNTKTILGGAQDNCVSSQEKQGNVTWQLPLVMGDGAMVAVNDSDPTFSARYFSAQQLGQFSRQVVDKDNQQLSKLRIDLLVGNQPFSTGQFLVPMVLNQADKTKLAFGTQGLYLAQDNLNDLKNLPRCLN